jgi:hypothetical protein
MAHVTEEDGFGPIELSQRFGASTFQLVGSDRRQRGRDMRGGAAGELAVFIVDGAAGTRAQNEQPGWPLADAGGEWGHDGCGRRVGPRTPWEGSE